MLPKKALVSGGTLLALIVLVIPTVTSIYVSSDPTACRICHEMTDETEALSGSAHREVACRTCHEEKGAAGWLIGRLDGQRMALAWLFGSYRKPIRAEVQDENCLRCHGRDTATTRVSRGIRVSHREFIGIQRSCTDCHNAVAHGKAVPVQNGPTLEKCALCHNGTRASNECGVCHVGTASLRDAVKVAPWSVTHGPTWKSSHGMGDLDGCALCHDTDYCSRCHKIELPHTDAWWGSHGRDALTFPESCRECHAQRLCDSCHPVEMPHPTMFLSAHSLETKRLGKDACLICHRWRNCKNCHERHTHPAGKFTRGAR